MSRARAKSFTFGSTSKPQKPLAPGNTTPPPPPKTHCQPLPPRKVTMTTIVQDSKLSIEKLEGVSNWKLWKVLVNDWLAEKGYETTITLTTPPTASTSSTPPVTQDPVNEWIKNKKSVLANLRQNISNEILVKIISCTIAKELWDRLVQSYKVSDYHELANIR